MLAEGITSLADGEEPLSKCNSRLEVQEGLVLKQVMVRAFFWCCCRRLLLLCFVAVPRKVSLSSPRRLCLTRNDPGVLFSFSRIFRAECFVLGWRVRSSVWSRPARSAPSHPVLSRFFLVLCVFF